MTLAETITTDAAAKAHLNSSTGFHKPQRLSLSSTWASELRR